MRQIINVYGLGVSEAMKPQGIALTRFYWQPAAYGRRVMNWEEYFKDKPLEQLQAELMWLTAERDDLLRLVRETAGGKKCETCQMYKSRGHFKKKTTVCNKCRNPVIHKRSERNK